MNDGKFQKVTIRAYSNKKLTKATGDEFVLPVNPDSYAENYKVDYDAKQGQGNQGTNPRFKSSAPLERKLEFIIDGTKTIEGYVYPVDTANQPIVDVRKQIKKLIDTVYKMNGDIHKPNYLKIAWDQDFTFSCILTDLNINYTLFKPNGNPLRAKISTTFLNYLEAERRAREEDKKSPDLTSVRRVSITDSLPLTTFEVYGDASLYIQVAKANNLTSIRNIDAANQLVFPPLDKTPAT